MLYDDLLNVRLPHSVTSIAFADDIAFVAKANENYIIAKDLTEAATQASEWLKEAGLQIAAQKSEALVISSRRTHTDVNIPLEGSVVQASRSIRYLGVQIDSKLGFTEHALHASTKASIASQKLSRIMPNISAAKARKRRLLANLVHSILLFGSPIWADRMSSKGTAEMSKVQRKTALRVASAYCTVSTAAALVVASMPPIDLLAKERRSIYIHKGDPDARGMAKDDTIEAWQTRWDMPGPGRWTHCLIPSIAQWLHRKHGNEDYHLTQFFTGHGCFSEYLHRFGKLDSPECWHCGHAVDDALHSIFVCDAWEIKRARVNILCGTTVTPDNIVNIMLSSTSFWDSISGFIHFVLKKKEDEERRRQTAQANLL